MGVVRSVPGRYELKGSAFTSPLRTRRALPVQRRLQHHEGRRHRLRCVAVTDTFPVQ